MSLFLVWYDLSSDLEAFLADIRESNARTVAPLNASNAPLPRKKPANVADLHNDIRAMGQRIDRLEERIDRLRDSLIHATPDLKRRLD